MNIRHTLYIILLGFLIVACADTTEVERYLDAADVHMEENPQMALETLESIDREMLTTRKVQAKFALLYTMALDKNYIDVASDSIIAPAVRYYQSHGTAKDKLLTYYYNGVISLNAGDTERAMENYVEAERYVGECGDKKAIAILYKAKMAIYSDLYEHDKAILQGKLAAQYFLDDCDTLRYINTINDITAQYDLLDDSLAVVTNLEAIRGHWDIMTDAQKSNYYAISLSNALKHPVYLEIASLLQDYQDHISDPRYIKWMVVANAYLTINDYKGASYALEQYDRYDGRVQLPYFWIKASIQEHNGLYTDAIEIYKQYISFMDSDKLSVIEGDTKFIEERYKSELKVLKQSLYIIVITFTLLIIILILIILSQRMKKVKEEKRIQKIEFDKERKVIVGEKEQVEAKYVLLKEEKEETERMFASLKAEIAQLKKIRKDKSIDKDIIASVEQRLNVLNMFILAELSDSFEKIAYAELGKLMEDREGFLESTRKTFMVSHPKFMSYLQKKNLTEWEIGCCCLYCIGFNGAELSEYLNRKAIYNVNSIIRQKLDIPKGGTQIDVFLKQKMQEFHS